MFTYTCICEYARALAAVQGEPIGAKDAAVWQSPMD